MPSLRATSDSRRHRPATIGSASTQHYGRPPWSLLLLVHLSSERTVEPVRQDSSFAEKQEPHPALLPVVHLEVWVRPSRRSFTRRSGGPPATPADRCAPLVTESRGRSGARCWRSEASVGPLSRYVRGFAWAVGSASRTTISLCRAQVEWQRSCGSNGTGHTPNCHTSDELAESGDTRWSEWVSTICDGPPPGMRWRCGRRPSG